MSSAHLERMLGFGTLPIGNADDSDPAPRFSHSEALRLGHGGTARDAGTEHADAGGTPFTAVQTFVAKWESAMIRKKDPRFCIEPPLCTDRPRSPKAPRRTLTVRPSWPAGRPDRVWTVPVPDPWEEGHSLAFDVTPTRQPCNRQRWWWVCRSCGRRRRVLLSGRSNQEFRCRPCLRAVYESDYRRRPTRRDRLRDAAGMAPVVLERLRRLLAALTARKRRGVRRGRHVHRRVARLAARIARSERRLQAHRIVGPVLGFSHDGLCFRDPRVGSNGR